MCKKNVPDVIGLIGHIGAGKDTFLEKTEFPKGTEVVSTSSLLRSAGLLDDPRELVTDDKVNIVVHDYISQNPNNSRTIILNGFPRTKLQTKANGVKLSEAWSFEISKELMLERVADRIVCLGCGISYTIKDDFHKPNKEGICDKCGQKLTRRQEDNPISAQKRWEVSNLNLTQIKQCLKNQGIEVITKRKQC